LGSRGCACGEESEVHAVGFRGILDAAGGADAAGDIHVGYAQEVRAAAAILCDDKLPFGGRRCVAALGNLVGGIAAAHCVTEGAEVVQGERLGGDVWNGGDATGLVVRGDVAVQGRGERTRAVVEADELLEGGGVSVYEDRVGEGVQGVLAILDGPAQDRGTVSEGGDCGGAQGQTDGAFRGGGGQRWNLKKGRRRTVNTLEGTSADFDTATGLGIEFFTWATDRRAAFGWGTEQMAPQETGLLGVGDGKHIG
jgi:hypothetical protein